MSVVEPPPTVIPMMAQQRTIPDKVIEQVADHEGVAPMDLTPPLYHAIDLDALESIMTEPPGDTIRDDVRVEFTYCDYDIMVDGTDVHIKES